MEIKVLRPNWQFLEPIVLGPSLFFSILVSHTGGLRGGKPLRLSCQNSLFSAHIKPHLIGYRCILKQQMSRHEGQNFSLCWVFGRVSHIWYIVSTYTCTVTAHAGCLLCCVWWSCVMSANAASYLFQLTNYIACRNQSIVGLFNSWQTATVECRTRYKT